MSHETTADYVYESAYLRAKKQGYSDGEARRYAQEQVKLYWTGEGYDDGSEEEDDGPRAA
jgi:hypothetical protein